MIRVEHKQVFRLCHVCNFLNESEEEILRCSRCTKSFLPMMYFERSRSRARQIAHSAENPIRSPMPSVAEELAAINRVPVNGLIVIW